MCSKVNQKKSRPRRRNPRNNKKQTRRETNQSMGRRRGEDHEERRVVSATASQRSNDIASKSHSPSSLFLSQMKPRRRPNDNESNRPPSNHAYANSLGRPPTFMDRLQSIIDHRRQSVLLCPRKERMKSVAKCGSERVVIKLVARRKVSLRQRLRLNRYLN